MGTREGTGTFNWSLERRIDKHVEVQGDCWVWIGSKTRNGYGQMSVGGRRYMAHRYVFTELTGIDPGKLDLDHLCRNRACVNPDHLEPVTRSENLLRGNTGKYHSTKTHCPHGHEYSVSNTYVNKLGKRSCRDCARIRAAKKREVARG